MSTDEPETDNRRSIVPDVRSEHSNTSGFSRRPTFDSNASRRDMLTAHGPLRGSSISNTAMGGSNLRRQWSVRSESHHPLAHPQGRHVNLHTPTTASGKTRAQTRKKNTIFNFEDLTRKMENRNSTFDRKSSLKVHL